MHVILETERLILRRFTRADIDLLVDVDSDPEVMRYITGGRPTPRAVYATTMAVNTASRRVMEKSA